MIKWRYGSPVPPCRLSEGVVATITGIFFAADTPSPFIKWLGGGLDDEYHIHDFEFLYEDVYVDEDEDGYFWAWPDAVERLRYREGEPWCIEDPMRGGIFCPDWGPQTARDGLHRLAAILCDTAEAFRVLHWCVHNLTALQEAGDDK